MAWITPKTDWHCSVDAEGNYTGDRFDYNDFNRIKNNLEFLREMSRSMYDDFYLAPMGNDRTPSDYFYADEINQIEENLKAVGRSIFHISYGAAPVYQDNGPTPDYAELNRLEGAILDIYLRLYNQSIGRRMFGWNLGLKGGL